MGLRFRHFRQRFDPGVRMIFRRAVTLGARRYVIGEPVPKNTDERVLRRLWRSEKIELEEWTPAKREPARVKVEISREEKVAAAVKSMDRNNKALWTKGGKPRVEAIEKIVGFDITMAERDAAHAD